MLTAPLADLPASFSLPWTRLGLFDSSGTNLLVENYFAGGWILVCNENACSPELPSDSPSSEFTFSLGAALRVSIPADGDYYLAVTGGFDVDYAGAHEENGSYALLVGLATVPEPSSLALLTLAVPALMFSRRRRSACAPTAMSFCRTADQI